VHGGPTAYAILAAAARVALEFSRAAKGLFSGTTCSYPFATHRMPRRRNPLRLGFAFLEVRAEFLTHSPNLARRGDSEQE
jgi:hypothetical protein